MKKKSNLSGNITLIIQVLMLCILFASLLTGCNRAAVRFKGTALGFPEAPTDYSAKIKYQNKLSIAIPADSREKYYGEEVADTKWVGCRTDSFYGDQAKYVIRDRVRKELAISNLFKDVSDAVESKSNDLLLSIEIHSFCSSVKGFLISRVAGIVSLDFTLSRDGQILYTKKLERVVTDADPEYTGSQVAFIEQAMRRTMADSLREVIKTLIIDLETELNSKLESA